jgi:hypothetical protein
MNAPRDLAAEYRQARDLYGPDDPRTEAAFDARLAELRASEPDDPGLYMVSFADETGHLGTAIVFAMNPIEAWLVTHTLDINPGGEVAVTPHALPVGAIDPKYCGRLLQRDEILSIPKPDGYGF